MTYPRLPRQRGEEGWVALNFMVSPDGKPYEITVTDSVGDPAFRKAAVNAVTRWRYRPATHDGRPIDAGVSQTLTFELEGPGGTRQSFAKEMRQVSALLEAGKVEEAAEQASMLNPLNLAEDTYLSVLRFQVAGSRLLKKQPGMPAMDGWPESPA